MASEIYQKYGLYNPASFAIKLMKSLELHQQSYEFRQRFRRNLEKVQHNGDYYIISRILQETLDESQQPFQNRTVNFLFASPDLDTTSFLKTYKNLYNPLIVTYTNKKDRLKDLLNEYNKHLSYFGLQDKTLVVVNFPRNADEIHKLKKIPVKPNRVIYLHDQPKSDCPKGYAETLKLHYPNVMHEFYANSENGQIEDLCKKVRMSLEFSEPALPTTKWLPRVAVIGPRGSGARLQAQLISSGCKIMFIDASQEIEKWKTNSDWFEYEKDRDYLYSAIICERLMQPDCLFRGYVLTGFPKTLKQLESVLKIPNVPNRLVFMNVRKSVCLKRKSKQLTDSKSLDDEQMLHVMDEIEEEVTQMLHTMNEMKNLCGGFKEKVEINANRSIDSVRNLLHPQISRTKNM